jgi:hypothetical protein
MDDMPQVWATMQRHIKQNIDITLNVGFGVEPYTPEGFNGIRMYNNIKIIQQHDSNRLLKVVDKFEERYELHFGICIKPIFITTMKKHVLRELLISFQKNTMQVILQELLKTIYSSQIKITALRKHAWQPPNVHKLRPVHWTR